ncbi:ABC transporter permease [Paracoccus fistulariae]|uniref:Iron ABC transporter permease n=1 Tax=Paracoccus fistulariae TaxID=658446 RepID=A0ABY7SM24_9RHOB|nr:iron ABC transporter permease [Paracoccus fistulariae]MDB6179960.1 iron ABC transporter permease [Paracoccus fistulariae]WCR08054.1 iron ABC transporter permease [Paracoccus fistulariae]
MSPRSGSGWQLVAILIAFLVMLPVLALVSFAAQGSPGLWSHLFRNVLASALGQTIILLSGVGVIVASIGTVTAWLIAGFDFPGRRILGWALLLPLAVPTYIIAYAYLDILHPIGPVQTLLRDLLGYDSPRDFRLPDIRSMTGCILLLGFVLYPYVYLPVRALFATQAANLLEASRTLGAGPLRVFWKIVLPLARPAIAAGIALALMETLNDIGAAEFLGVRTLTVSVYSTWLNRTDLPGASQIALVMLVIVVSLVLIERRARKGQRYAGTARRHLPLARVRLRGPAAWVATILCALPVLIGFVAPASYLVQHAWRRYVFSGIPTGLWSEALQTALLALIATFIAVVLGLLIAAATRLQPGPVTRFSVRVATLGYAVPGTILAIGLLPVIIFADRQLTGLLGMWGAAAPQLILLGSGAALIYAYVARFLAIAVGGIEAGMTRVPQSMDHAARSLGQSPAGVFRHIHMPLSRASMIGAGLLIFVDCVKELPATLLLRPLNVETLATRLYGEAARGTYEDASIAALLIVLIGMVPVFLLSNRI